MTAEEYAAYANSVHITIGEDDDKTFEEYIKDAFDAGMQEMREQLMKNAVECDVMGYGTGWLTLGYLPECDYDFKKDDKVKLIIIKED